MPNRPVRFLIADDDPLILDQLELIIRSLGEVVVARVSNGEQAISVFKQLQPDIVILDIVMPVLDGFATYQAIRQQSSAQQTVFIFISANYSSECIGLELGANEFLSKPFNTNAVVVRLRNQIALLKSKRALQIPVQELQEERELLSEIVQKMRRVNAFDGRYISYTESPSERSEGNTVLSAFTKHETQYILVGNFSSYGIPAALSGALVTYLFYQLTQEQLGLSEILTEVNRVLFQQFPTQLFMAACAVEIPAHRKQAHIWNFGMHPTLLLSQQQAIHKIASYDLPLGILDNLECSQAHTKLTLTPGDQLYLFSKAINTTRCDQAEQYNTSKLETLLAKIHQQQRALHSVWPELSEYNKQYNWSDDAVLVAISA